MFLILWERKRRMKTYGAASGMQLKYVSTAIAPCSSHSIKDKFHPHQRKTMALPHPFCTFFSTLALVLLSEHINTC